MADSLFNDLREDVVRFANADPAIPAIYQWKQFVEEQNGLVSFGPDLEEAYRMIGAPVKKILIDHVDPATMTCSTSSAFTVYVKAATALKQLNMRSAEIPKSADIARRKYLSRSK